MLEIYFLWGLALVWLVFASVQDLRTRDISNWLNWSLIIFALGFRFFYSLFGNSGFGFFYQGLIGFGIFWLLSNLFYYGKMYAGGDYRLMVALGAILPVSTIFVLNVELMLIYLLIFFIVGAVYGLSVSFYFGLKNFSKMKKEFKIQFGKNKTLLFSSLIFACLFLLISFWESLFFVLGICIFILPYLYLFLKSVDEVCMVRKIKTNKLTPGDWLYNDEKVSGRLIKATWDGLDEKDIKLLRKKKEVWVRFGVQYGPVFLISFVVFVVVYFLRF